MSNFTRTGWLLAAAIGVSACGILEPRLPDAAPEIPAEWPLPPTTAAMVPGAAAPATQATADIGWREFFTDANLEELIAQALANNRDLRIAVLNVEKARAQYRIQRADRVPSIDATGAMYRAGNDGRTTETFSASVGITEYELDLFGRVRNLSESALQRYLAQEETRRSAQLSLIAEVANVYLTLAADQEQLRLARATLATREQSYAITEKRHELGAVSGLDLSQSRTLVEGARADAARYAGQVAQDINALNLLVGAPVDPQRLPAGFADPVSGLAELPAGLPSEVLLRRPDVLAAEHVLRATNANIGAARAAFFPSISLTGSIGSVSTELSGLFDGGTQVWTFTPQVRVPIFEGGRLRANLHVTQADRDIALAQYERSIQQGFREVADALALTSSLAEQRSALQALVDAARQGEALAQARYSAGRDSYLVRLESQRTLYVAEQALISTRLAEQSNRVVLYKVLGGGWLEVTP
jgi:outer membrane protein, multidrug efflux system